MSRHPDLIECLYLVKNGVPFETAFALPLVWRRAFAVAIGEMAGAKYDWQTFGWEPVATAG
ncbi:MAG: hypothetical protein HIU92_17750 [Proteobacteria bacterium]|nr:hypothetical protein [Pseudomonadota bacterium]